MYVNVLAGSLIIRVALNAGLRRSSTGFALVVVGAVTVANVINFLLAATWIRVHSGVPVPRSFAPVPPAAPARAA